MMHYKYQQSNMIPKHAFTWRQYVREVEGLMSTVYKWVCLAQVARCADARLSPSCHPTRPRPPLCLESLHSFARHCIPGRTLSTFRTDPLIATCSHRAASCRPRRLLRSKSCVKRILAASRASTTLSAPSCFAREPTTRSYAGSTCGRARRSLVSSSLCSCGHHGSSRECPRTETVCHSAKRRVRPLRHKQNHPWSTVHPSVAQASQLSLKRLPADGHMRICPGLGRHCKHSSRSFHLATAVSR